MHTFEDARGDSTRQLGSSGRLEYIDIFGTDDYIDGDILSKALVDTFKFVSGKGYCFVLKHEAVQDVAFSDEIGNERVDGFVVNVCRGAYLLDAAFAHHDDGVAQSKGFFLVVGNVDEGDSKFLVHLFQLHLHVFTHFEVESGKGLVQ